MVDNKTVLDPEDDVAHVKLGGKWRIPTQEEWKELDRCCDCSFTVLNEVEGLLITGPNGNSIFVPATGYWVDSKHVIWYSNAGYGHYWSSTLSDGSPESAAFAHTYTGGFTSEHIDRYMGFPVRPVTD